MLELILILAPKTQRLEIIEQIKALEKYYGLDFSQLVN